jgi:protein-tyrosine phosphatase
MYLKIKSLSLYFIIQLERVADHGWRYMTGLPLARRSMITPHIYLGGQYGSRSLARLKRLGVTAIVNMRTRSIHKDLTNVDLKVLNLPTRDKFAPTIEQLINGCQFMDQEIKSGGKVYIHCLFGEERGATMTIAYLIWTGLTFEDAFALVKKVRVFINPVPVQLQRLHEFENIINEKKQSNLTFGGT